MTYREMEMLNLMLPIAHAKWECENKVLKKKIKKRVEY